MKKQFAVTLTATERGQLLELIAAGAAPARVLMHARILLKADQGPLGPGWVDERIAEAVETSQPTVSRVRKQYVQRDWRRRCSGGRRAGRTSARWMAHWRRASLP